MSKALLLLAVALGGGAVIFKDELSTVLKKPTQDEYEDQVVENLAPMPIQSEELSLEEEIMALLASDSFNMEFLPEPDEVIHDPILLQIEEELSQVEEFDNFWDDWITE